MCPNNNNFQKNNETSNLFFLAEICRLTGGCHYYTWVPHFLEPNGHRNCKLYKNFCCKRHVHKEPSSGSQIRISGQKFQKCPTYGGYGG